MNVIQYSLAEIWTMQAHMEEILSLVLPKLDKNTQQNELLGKFRNIVLDLKVLIK